MFTTLLVLQVRQGTLYVDCREDDERQYSKVKSPCDAVLRIGAVMGITTAFACVYPMSQYSLFFVINMPAAALIGKRRRWIVHD